MDLSIIIPVKNEQDNILPLLQEIETVLSKQKLIVSFEIIIINDASTDNTVNNIKNFSKKKDNIILYSHHKSFGQSSAIATGFINCTGNWIMTIDGDGQNDPNALTQILPIVFSGSTKTFYQGFRANRIVSKNKKIASILANKIRKLFLKDNARDSGCGFKILSKELVRVIPLFKNMHRFIPALAKRSGYEIYEFPINDRNRKYGKSNYGIIKRALQGIYDIYGVSWLIKRSINIKKVLREN